MNTKTRTNVAPRSTNGHYLTTTNVVLVNEQEEIFDFHPAAGETLELETENHGTIEIDQEGTVFTQDEYRPLEDIVVKALD